MATINLGRVKPVFRGAYNASTAYVIDDIVTYQDETYIAITATTGNLPTVTSNWTKLAAKGTDGTDVSTTLTTQGDILFRDGSGLQKLAAGTSGQYLETRGSGADPVWSTVSSEVVKLASSTVSTAVASIAFDDIFDDTTYNSYLILFRDFDSQTDGQSLHMNLRTGGASGSNYTGTDYVTIFDHLYESSGTMSNNNHSYIDQSSFRLLTNGVSGTGKAMRGDVFIGNLGAGNYPMATVQSQTQDNSGQFDGFDGYFRLENHTQSFTGMSVYYNSGNITAGTINVYGYKK